MEPILKPSPDTKNNLEDSQESIAETESFPSKTNDRKRLYIVMATLFCILTILLVAGLFFLDTEQQDKKIVNSGLNENMTDNAQVSLVESIRNGIEDIVTPASYNLKISSNPNVLIYNEEIQNLVPVISTLKYDIDFNNPSDQDRTLIKDQIEQVLISNGMKRSVTSPQTLEEAGAISYADPYLTCTIDYDFTSYIACYTSEAVTKIDILYYQSLFKALNGPEWDTNDKYLYGIMVDISKQVEIGEYLYQPGSLGSYEFKNGIYTEIPSGGGLDFYRRLDSSDWLAFSTGQSIHSCIDYNSEALKTIYSDTACVGNNSSDETNVSDYFKS